MGTRFLLDTNAAIYYFKNSLPEKGKSFLLSALSGEQVAISFVSEIEMLAYTDITPSEEAAARILILWVNVLWIDEAIVSEAISIRKQTKLKLPDALIAATALVNKLELITSNIQDFTRVKDLKIINPLSI